MLRSIKRRFGALPLVVLALVGFGLPAISSAACDPYAALVSAVDFTSVTTDVIAVAALVVVVLVALRAVKFIYRVISGR